MGRDERNRKEGRCHGLVGIKRLIVLVCALTALTFAGTASAVIDCQQGVKCVGTDGDNTMEGTAAADWIVGLGGHDVIYGKDAGDTLEGNAGNDELYGGWGVNHLFGGGGSDDLFAYQLSCSGQDFQGGADYDVAYYMADAGNSFISVENRVKIGQC